MILSSVEWLECGWIELVNKSKFKFMITCMDLMSRCGRLLSGLGVLNSARSPFHSRSATPRSAQAPSFSVNSTHRSIPAQPIFYPLRSHALIFSLTYESLKTGQPCYLCSLLSFPWHRCTQSSSLITFSHPSLTSPLKLQTDLIIILLLFVEQFPIWSTSRCTSHHSFTYIQFTCLWSFNLFFSLKAKNPSLSLFH